MTQNWVCETCRRIYEVGSAEIEHVDDPTAAYPCITPLCRGRIHLVPPSVLASLCAQGFVVETIPFRSFFRAICGFGKFDGAPAACSVVKKLLMTQKITEVVAEPVGNPERTILQQIVFEGGTRLHFALSSHGACCYYVEAAGPSCVEVLDREQSVVRTEAAVAVGNQDREEAGRAPGGQPGVDAEEQREPSS